MSADTHEGASDQSRPPSGSTLDRIVDGSRDIIMSLPGPMKALVVLGVVIAGGMFLYQKFHDPGPKKDNPLVVIQTAPIAPNQQYSGGQADPTHAGADNSLQTVEAQHKAAEDGAAFAWHTAHRSDDDSPDVPLMPKTDADNYLYYIFYAKTDRCIFIDRRIGGVDHTQWVRDPTYHKHDIDMKPGAHGALTPGKLFELPVNLVPTAYAATSFVPVQANYCVNPHPNPAQFKYWWGPPMDQCNSPIYRQFQDGCVHYQLYNRCANSWDGRIFWVGCHPPPHY